MKQGEEQNGPSSRGETREILLKRWQKVTKHLDPSGLEKASKELMRIKEKLEELDRQEIDLKKGLDHFKQRFWSLKSRLYGDGYSIEEHKAHIEEILDYLLATPVIDLFEFPLLSKDYPPGCHKMSFPEDVLGEIESIDIDKEGE